MNIFENIKFIYYRTKLKKKSRKFYESIKNSDNTTESTVFNEIETMLDSEDDNLIKDLNPYTNNNNDGPTKDLDASLYYFDEDSELPTYFFKDKGEPYTYSEKSIIREGLCGKTIWERCNASLIGAPDDDEIAPFYFKSEGSSGIFVPSDTPVIKISDSDKMIAIINHTENFCCFPDEKYMHIFRCNAIVSERILKLFGEIKDYYEILSELRLFATMASQQQNYLLECASRPTFSGEYHLKNVKTPISGKENLKLLYKLSKHTYSPSMQLRIEDWFEQLENAHLPELKTGLLNQLSYVLNIDSRPKNVENKKSYDEIMAILNKHIYGLENVKQQVVEHLLYIQHVGTVSNMAMLLVGNPGVGKTSICEAIAEALDVDLAFVNCSCQGGLAFAGSVRMYSGSEPSKISKAFYSCQSTNVVLQLDEVDKVAANDKDGNPYGAITELLGPKHRYNDVYFDADFYLDLSNTLVIATANDITKIPDYIVNRFDNVFYIDDYSIDFKLQIGKNYSIPKLLKQAKVSPSEIQFTDEALHLIAEKFCNDCGARLMESNVKTLIRKAITGWSMGREKKPLVIDTSYVLCHLEKNEFGKKSIGF